MKSQEIEIGKRYWYRWDSDSWAVSGICLAKNEGSVIVEPPYKTDHGESRRVSVVDIHCEDTNERRQPLKPWWKIW